MNEEKNKTKNYYSMKKKNRKYVYKLQKKKSLFYQHKKTDNSEKIKDKEELF